MNKAFKTLNTITAVGTLLNSVFYLAAPSFSIFLLGRTTNPIGLMNTRMAGACGMGLLVINWASRNVVDRKFQQIVAAGNMAVFIFLVMVELHGTLSGAMNWVGWLFLVADTSLGIGYTIFLILSYRSNRVSPPQMGETSQRLIQK